MKKIKYLILLILFIPVVALAEPIHLTQAALEECFANEGVYNETYKMTFKLEYALSGFFLSGDEYIVDEDLDLHKAHFGTENHSAILNLNGHTLTTKLAKYSPVPGYLSLAAIIGCSTEGCDLTVNGPGTIDITNNGYYAVANETGKITLNNVEIIGDIKVVDYNNTYNQGIELNLNNVSLNGNIEALNAKLNIDGGRYNYGAEYGRNQINATIANIKNTVMGSQKGRGLDIFDDTTHHTVSHVTVKNSNVTGGDAAISISSDGSLTVENSELWSNGILGSGYYGLTIEAKDNTPTIQMADVHLHTDHDTGNYPTIRGVVETPTDTEEFFNSLVKPGYIYWKNPDFDSIDYAAAAWNNGAYTLKELKSRDIWIIKQQQDYNVEDEPLYVIPNENEVTIKVLGEKDLFEGVEVNDDELEDDQYTAEEGINDNNENTVDITLDNNYLKSLDEGVYTIKVVFANGEAEATLTVTEEDPNVVITPPTSVEEPADEGEVKGEEETKTNPKTGLPNHMLLLIPITLIGGLYVLIKRKTYFKGV